MAAVIYGQASLFQELRSLMHLQQMEAEAADRFGSLFNRQPQDLNQALHILFV